MMKKRLDKKDYRNMLFLTLILIVLVFALTRFKYMYGSDTDWSAQHFAIPDYFRKLFYSTGDFFPSFAPNIGAGENIYVLSYYGLFSPIILFSYLLPFVKMSTYIQISGIVLSLTGILLFYRYIRKKYDHKFSMLLSLVYLSASPLIFHGHRHIMFVNYMPFLILAFEATDNYFENKNKNSIMIWSLLIILSSWFFSVSALLVILIYAIYKYLLQTEKFDIKDFFREGFNFSKRLIISVMISAVLLLPTVYVLMSGRDKSNVEINLKDFIPGVKFDYIGYSTYALGLGCFAVFSIITAVISKDKARRFLGIVFSLLGTCPIFVWILNGTMYFDAKVMIPFIPLAVILCGYQLKDFANKKTDKKSYIIFILIFIIDIIFGEKYTSAEIIIKADLICFAVCMLIYKNKNSMKSIYISLVAVPLISMASINLDDMLVEKEQYEKNNSESYIILSKVISEDENIVRSSVSDSRSETVNMIYSTDHYSPYIYSSIHNKLYNDFYFNDIQNENEFRNSALTTYSFNPLFNMFIGNKYVMSRSDNNPSGYEYVCSDNGVNLYKNEDVLPIGYCSDKVIGKEQYLDLDTYERMESLVNCVVTDDYSNFDFKPTVKFNENINLDESLEISKITDGYHIISDNQFELNEKLQKPVCGKKIFIISIDVDNTIGKKDDVKIKINGTSNKLTDPTWKYYNNNTNFTYVYLIEKSETLENLDFVFSKGDYIISDIKSYVMDYPEIKSDIDEFKFDKQLTKGDDIIGSINCTKDGWFVMTFPYTEGYNIKVDGKKQDYECVNEAFIGFKIEKGKHEIEIHYNAPLQKEGIIISVFGIISALILVIYNIFTCKK